MKLSVALALATFQAASAFTAVSPAASASTKLFSTPAEVGTYEGVGTDVPAGATPGGALTMGTNVPTNDIWDQLDVERVQGGHTLRTWSFTDAERLLVRMSSDDRTLSGAVSGEGRLMHATVDLCQGPDNVPLKMVVKSGKGKLRPFKSIIETPRQTGSLFIRNIGEIEFPITASVGGVSEEVIPRGVYDMANPRILQGNSVVTFPVEPSVNQCKVLIKTDGRPLNASIELLMGPNAIRYSMDVYTEDGIEWPFFTIIETPGAGNSIRIVNTKSVEFPLTVSVEPL